MKRYLVYSGASHGLFFALCLSLGSLLSKPRMSYYAVDLFMSSPAGPSGTVKSSQVIEEPKSVAAPPVVEEKRLPPKETIRVKGKVKPPHLVAGKKRLKIPARFLGKEQNSAARGGGGAGGL